MPSGHVKRIPELPRFNLSEAPMDFLSAAEAARRLRVHPETIRLHCRTGRIGRRVLGRWRLDATEVEALLAGFQPSPKTGGGDVQTSPKT